LFRVLAHPALDNGGNFLHRSLNVDPAFRVACWCDLVGEFDPEMMSVRLAHDTHAVNGEAGKLCELR
jgi:hypothetical protein